jgi:flagellar motor switch protein FliM
MTGHAKVQHGVARDDLTLLRHSKLGRPYHSAAQRITDTLGKHPRWLGDYFLRHYRIALEGDGNTLHEQPPRPADYYYQSRLGRFGFAADRALLAELLECYYGGARLAEPVAGAVTEPVSASEQRLHLRLGHDLVRLCGELLLGGYELSRLESCNPRAEEPWEFVLELALLNPVSGQRGAVLIYLDGALVDEIIHRLPGTEAGARGHSAPVTIGQLPVRLDCVLAHLRMPLSRALALKPDDILMLRLPDRCDVRINQLTLFTGTVAQQGGALVLNSLESVKKP